MKQSKKTLIWRFLKPYAWIFALTLAFSMANTVLGSLTPQVVRVAVDSILGGEPLPEVVTALAPASMTQAAPLTQLLYAAGFLLIVAVLSGLCTYGSRMGTAKGSESFVKSLRDALYRHIQRLPYAWHVEHSTGEIIQRCTSDVEVVRNFVTNQLLEVCRTIFLVGFSLAVMFSMNWKTSLIALGFLPVILLYSGFFYSKIARRFLTADEAEGELSATVQENLTGVRVVRAFAQESSELDKFTRRNKAYHDITLHLTTLMGAYWGLSDMIGYLQIALSGVCGVYFAVHGGFSLGNVLLFTTYTSMLTFPMRQLGRILADLGKADISLSRLEDILAVPAEAEPGKALTPQIDGSVAFEDVCFDYGDGVPVLSHVSFTVRPGQTIGILGSTGAGKSSLVQLLQRLYPVTAGRITLSGVNVNDIERHHLRRNVGIVLQEPFLYSRTIGENIAIARPDADLSDVYAAARTASVHDVIESFSEGYDTVVGERGVTLSGGQKQRVAIARMLLQDTPVLIFDDSLSAVDAETDAAIRDALHSRRHGTMFLISHRIATIRKSDLILVLDKGRVVQMGTHDTLAAQEGLYRRVCAIQNELPQAASPKGGEA